MAVPACATMGADDRTRGSPASMAARAVGSRRSCARTGDEARVRIVPRFAEVLAAPEAAGGDRGRHADRAAAAHRSGRTRRGELRAAAARRAAVVGVLGAVAGGDLGRAIMARPAGSRPRPPTRRARCRSSSSTSRRKSARWTRRLRDRARRAGAGVRGASRAGVLAAERRPAADRTEEGQGPLPRARPGAAPPVADRGRVAGRRRQRAAAQGRRRPTTCSTRWPAPPSPGASTPARRSRSRIRRRATHSALTWPSGHDVC